MKVKLYAPEAFWTLTADQLLDISNGCGGKGVGILVPDKFFGLNMKPACDIHDYMYKFGPATDQGKIDADTVFLNNLVRICTARYLTDNKMWLYKIRLNLCQKYYSVVDAIGGPWYWANKNEPSEVGVYDI